MAQVLILACGNPLRGDDGVAWQAADLLRKRLSSDQADILSLHQFTPELAETASHAETVVFLDATVNGTPGEIVCQPVGAESSDSHFSHHLAPASVLALTRQLYGVSPQGYVVSLCGESFDHREGLSEVAAAALPEMVQAVERVLASESSVEGSEM